MGKIIRNSRQGLYIKLWNNDCNVCCMYCSISCINCPWSCIKNNIYCFECETGKELEEEND